MDQFLGVVPSTGFSAGQQPVTSSDIIDCVVLDDAGLGFRDNSDRWPAELTSTDSQPAHVLFKFAGSLNRGPLLNHLLDAHDRQLTAYLAVGDLRKGYAPIGQPHSWQRLAEEVVSAVDCNESLRRCRRVIVSLGVAGALLIEQGNQPLLVFDPMHLEGDWERTRPGATSGLGTCIMAAMALAVAQDPSSPDWPEALSRGLLAARTVHEQGYDYLEESEQIRFPITQAIERLVDPGDADQSLSRTAITLGKNWLVAIDDPQKLTAVARTIVREGLFTANLGIPVERMGSWVSVDRTEIESIRSVRLIVQQYLSQPRRQKPLNLAVFGPPGSGKSFAVKQLAKEWAASSQWFDILEFNVSQFTSTLDLGLALQRVRDAAVEQTMPLVFWDEFDTPLEDRELGWLARFLAPMQDGVFMDGGQGRPIGPAIFVFAGGTHPTLTSFKERAVSVPGAKATDFLSRLRGHIDVLGPNQYKETDVTFVLRRALLLRALLSVHAPQLTYNGNPSIDPGVLHALLEVPEYLHGARSMEAIIEMSGLAGSLKFERSALPAPHQLALHVDAEAFLSSILHE